MNDDAHEDGYAGAVSVLVADQAVAAEAKLRGYFEPIDGRYHWYGRLTPNPSLDKLVSGSVSASLRTPYGTAEGRLGDVDPWGRLRVSGVGRPPFKIAMTLADVEG
jgi:hypothetical protein